MAKRPEAKLGGGGKFKKWLRMVGLLTIKKYGGRILSHLFFAYLLAEMSKDMHLIWKDFSYYKNCQDKYVETVSVNVSKQYNEAADVLMSSVLARAKCLTKGLDLDMPKPFPDIPLGSLPTGWMKDVFGWFNPISINFTIPRADLKVESNTKEVVESVNHDLHIFTKIGFWTRLAGFILAIFSIFKILFTATWYTLRNKVWMPSMKSHIVRFYQFIRVVGAYIVGSLSVFIQAYATDKFCKISINDTDLKTPKCELLESTCSLDCDLGSHKYSSPCKQCHVKLHWWWIEPFSTPNILCGAYIGFMLLVLVFECCEAGFQLRQALKAKQKEREKKRRAQLESRARRRRQLEKPLLEEASSGSDLATPEIVEQYERSQQKHKEKRHRHHHHHHRHRAPANPAGPSTSTCEIWVE